MAGSAIQQGGAMGLSAAMSVGRRLLAKHILGGHESADNIITKVVSAEHERLKSKLASEDALDIFRNYDADKSGSIDYGEFVEALMAMELVKDAKDPVAKAMFDAFDPDGSGEVDYEEFQIYASNELRDPEGSHKVKKLGEELKANNTR